jgi:RNA polymerase sigma factor (sigma-70 family)
VEVAEFGSSPHELPRFVPQRTERRLAGVQRDENSSNGMTNPPLGAQQAPGYLWFVAGRAGSNSVFAARIVLRSALDLMGARPHEQRRALMGTGNDGMKRKEIDGRSSPGTSAIRSRCWPTVADRCFFPIPEGQPALRGSDGWKGAVPWSAYVRRGVNLSRRLPRPLPDKGVSSRSTVAGVPRQDVLWPGGMRPITSGGVGNQLMSSRLDSVDGPQADESRFHSTWPSFLDLVDSDPNEAWRQFYSFAMREIRSAPPRRLRKFQGPRRDDAIRGLLCHFCDRSFRVLRSYRNEGGPFVAWFVSVANNWLTDEYRRLLRQLKHEEQVDWDVEEPGSPDPQPSPADSVFGREITEAVHRALEGMGRLCRLLLIGRFGDGYTPMELTAMLGWPRDQSTDVSEKIRQCRRSLAKRLTELGFDDSRVAGLSALNRGGA